MTLILPKPLGNGYGLNMPQPYLRSLSLSSGCVTGGSEGAGTFRYTRRVAWQGRPTAGEVRPPGVPQRTLCGGALATVVGVLVEVPVMLSVVRITMATRSWYERTN